MYRRNRMKSCDSESDAWVSCDDSEDDSSICSHQLSDLLSAYTHHYYGDEESLASPFSDATTCGDSVWSPGRTLSEAGDNDGALRDYLSQHHYPSMDLDEEENVEGRDEVFVPENQESVHSSSSTDENSIASVKEVKINTKNEISVDNRGVPNKFQFPKVFEPKKSCICALKMRGSQTFSDFQSNLTRKNLTRGRNSQNVAPPLKPPRSPSKTITQSKSVQSFHRPLARQPSIYGACRCSGSPMIILDPKLTAFKFAGQSPSISEENEESEGKSSGHDIIVIKRSGSCSRKGSRKIRSTMNVITEGKTATNHSPPLDEEKKQGSDDEGCQKLAGVDPKERKVCRTESYQAAVSQCALEPPLDDLILYLQDASFFGSIQECTECEEEADDADDNTILTDSQIEHLTSKESESKIKVETENIPENIHTRIPIRKTPDLLKFQDGKYESFSARNSIAVPLSPTANVGRSTSFSDRAIVDIKTQKQLEEAYNCVHSNKSASIGVSSKNQTIAQTFKRLMNSPNKKASGTPPPPPLKQPDVVDSGIPTTEEKRQISIRKFGTNIARKFTRNNVLGSGPNSNASTPTEDRSRLNLCDEDSSTEKPDLYFKRALVSASAALNGRAEGNPQLMVYEEMLKLFKCPGCDQVMPPPYPQCRKGHIVCTTCKQTLKNVCPVCKQRLTDSNNLMMAQVYQLLRLPCRFSGQGCIELNTLSEKTNHESYCSFQPIVCHYSPEGCEVVLPYSQIEKHITSCQFRS